MRQKIITLCVVSLFIVCFAIQSGSAQGTDPSLTGSWQLTLVPSTLPTFQVPALANFTSDGGAVATASAILVGVGAVSSTGPTLAGPTPAIGNWNDGGAEGLAVFKLVSIITTTGGTLYATRTFIADGITVSSGTLSGSYNYSTVNTSGTVVESGSGTLTGTLIPHFLPPGS
ncbi:MAG TPA: hypothetical protein VI756_32110 [Blastocatellia bacterium]